MVAAGRLQSVWGIGASVAKTLVAAGCLSVAQLVGEPKFSAKISEGARLCARLDEELQTPIPRAEMDSIYERVRLAAQTLPRVVATHIAGSHRRGKASAHDVDVLVVVDDAEAECAAGESQHSVRRASNPAGRAGRPLGDDETSARRPSAPRRPTARRAAAARSWTRCSR